MSTHEVNNVDGAEVALCVGIDVRVEDGRTRRLLVLANRRVIALSLERVAITVVLEASCVARVEATIGGLLGLLDGFLNSGLEDLGRFLMHTPLLRYIL